MSHSDTVFESATTDCCTRLVSVMLDNDSIILPSSVSHAPTPVGENSPEVQLHPDLQQIDNICCPSEEYTSSKPADKSMMIHYLPDELILKIFSYFSFHENINILQKVCTHWKNLAQDVQLWHDKPYVIRSNNLDEEVVRTLREAPQLRAVIFRAYALSSVFQELSKKCHELKTLDIHCSQSLDGDVIKNLLDACRKLHTLKVPYRILESINLMEAGGWLENLQVLHLTSYTTESHTINPRCLADRCPHLCSVHFASVNYRMQDMEYFINAKKHMLKDFGVAWTSVEERFIFPLLIACVDTLVCLDLDGSNWSEMQPDDVFGFTIEEAAEAFTAVGQLHNLRKLSLHYVDNLLNHLVPLPFRNGHLSKLQVLWLGEIILNDDIVRTISNVCHDLRELQLDCCHTRTAAALEPLQKLKQLEILKIRYCLFGGEEMQYFARLPALHTLHYLGERFECVSPGVECILEMSALRCLRLKECICLEVPFAKFPGRLINLRELDITESTGDNSVIEKIRVEMPELKVRGKLLEYG